MNKFKGKCLTLLENTLNRYQQGGFLAGDYVKIKKNALKSEMVDKMSDAMKNMIKVAMKENTHLRVSYIKSTAAEAMNGPINAANIPGCLWADIVFEYAPGMWKDPMTVPVEILEKIEMDGDMTGYAPYKQNIKRPNNEIRTPVEVKNTNNADKEVSITHNLTVKNTKLANTPAPKDGREGLKKPKKLHESAFKNEADMIWEAYNNKPSPTQSKPSNISDDEFTWWYDSVQWTGTESKYEVASMAWQEAIRRIQTKE